MDKEIQEALAKAKAINEENARLSSEFHGNFAYVKSYQDACLAFPDFDKNDIISFFKILESAVVDINAVNNLVLAGRDNFIDNVKKKTSSTLLSQGLYKKLNLKNNFNSLLSKLFVNLQLY